MKFWILAEVNSKYEEYRGSKDERLQHNNKQFLYVSRTCQKITRLKNINSQNSLSKLKTPFKRHDCSWKEGKFSNKFFFQEESGYVFVNYQCKKNKFVCLLSTMHLAPNVSDNDKKKTEIKKFYNKNKVGVDDVDQIL